LEPSGSDFSSRVSGRWLTRIFPYGYTLRKHLQEGHAAAGLQNRNNDRHEEAQIYAFLIDILEPLRGTN
jgi:hypothetical protein